MSWVKLDDSFADHPKVQAAGPLASWLCVAGWCYAARYLTNGHIPRAAVARLIDANGTDPYALAAKLVEAGLWEAVEDGYEIHDYLVYNPTREAVQAERDAARGRMRQVRAIRRGGIGVKAYLEQSASEPTVIGDRPSADFDHLPKEVREAGARIRNGKSKQDREERLADALKTLGLR